ncbi:hypothetical protein XENOCAPTIV_010085, partial [Xenoophorus captivus]
LQTYVSRFFGWCLDPVDWKSWCWTTPDSKQSLPRSSLLPWPTTPAQDLLPLILLTTHWRTE